jgi:hypothetical protein
MVLLLLTEGEEKKRRRGERRDGPGRGAAEDIYDRRGKGEGEGGWVQRRVVQCSVDSGLPQGT